MNAIVFDAGPIISLTTNNLLWLLKDLKKKYDGNFYIPESVKEELITRPLSTKKYKFEALQVLPYIADGTLKILKNNKIRQEMKKILDIANNIYFAKDTFVKIVHRGEIEAIALLKHLNAETFVIDERATRMLIEEPEKLAKRLQKRLHTKVSINKEKLDEFKEYSKNIKVIRSLELVTIAYEKGLLDRFMKKSNEKYIKNIKKNLIEALLWGVKLNGCAVSEDEIHDVVKAERSYIRK